MAKPEADDSVKSLFQRVSDLGARYLSVFGESIAGYRVGQILFRKVDDVLRILEKTLQWSVQPQINPSPLDATEADKKSNACLMTNGSKKSKMYPGELVRPLPWVLFIPLLMIIRVVRKGAELHAWMLKKEATSPKHMVRYIQGVRRRLRAIKYRGMRNARTGVATQGDADKSHVSTTPSSPSSPSVSKAQQRGDGSDFGSGSLCKNKRKLSDRDGSSSDDDDDDDDDAVNALDAEATPRQGSYLSQLLSTAEASDSDNDPDFQPNSSMEANSSDSDALGSDESDDEPPHSIEVKRLSQPTSLINADIIEEEVEDSVDSSTISISEVEDQDVDNKPEMIVDEASVSSRRVVEGGGDQGQETGHSDEVGSEYGSCTVSLSAKSVDIASSIEQSDRSDSSAMQKMSSLFAIKKKKPADVK